MKRLFLILPIFVLSLTACDWFDDDDDNPPPPEPVASLRVLHGSPDAPAVDVLVDGSPVLTNVPYKAASGYLNVPAGGFDVAINVAGTSTTVLTLTGVNLTADTEYTVIAANTAANLEALLLNDANSQPASGELAVRVVHGAPAAPAVDVYVTAPGEDLANATPAVAAAAFKDASGFLNLPAGDYRIRLTPAGATDVVYDSGTVPLAAGAELTIVALEAAANGASPVTLVALTGDTANPLIEIPDDRARVRAAHLSPDAPNVDVLVDGNAVLTDVPFKAVSGYLLLNSGEYQIDVNVTGTANTVLSATPDLEPGDVFTLAAVNFVASLEALLISDDLSAPETGNAHVRVVHASPDAPNVDVYVDGAEVLTDVPFKAVSDYLPVAAGDRNLQVNATGTNATVIDVTPTLEDGGIYTVIAANAVASLEAILVKDN